MEFRRYLVESIGNTPLGEAIIAGYDACEPLRQATPDELERLIHDATRMEHQVYRQDWDDNQESILDSSQRFIDDALNGTSYAITKTGNDIVVYGPYKDDTIFIYVLYLDEGLRGQGLGTELLQHVIDFAGDKPVRLCVAKNNYIAQGLYRKFGFDIINENQKQYEMER